MIQAGGRRYRVLGALPPGQITCLVVAEDLSCDPPRMCVLKSLRPRFARVVELRRMFGVEGRILELVDHPNVVRLKHLPVIDGRLWLDIEYVDGWSLKSILATLGWCGVGVPLDLALNLVVQALRGMDHVHHLESNDRRLHVVHRDLAPGNIMVGRNGVVKIIDFGVAQSVLRESSASVVKGTPMYMAPEQIEGRACTPRSDVFSLAVVLVEAIAGRSLFEAESVAETLLAIVRGERPTVRNFLTGIRPSIADVIERALSVNPYARYGSARHFSDELVRTSGIDTKPMRDLGRYVRGTMTAEAGDTRRMRAVASEPHQAVTRKVILTQQASAPASSLTR